LPICAHALVGAGATTTTAVTPGNEISTRELMSPGAVCARTIVVHRTIDLDLISHQFQAINLHASTVAAKVVECQALALGVTFGDRPVYLGVGPAVGEHRAVLFVVEHSVAALVQGCGPQQALALDGHLGVEALLCSPVDDTADPVWVPEAAHAVIVL